MAQVLCLCSPHPTPAAGQRHHISPATVLNSTRCMLAGYILSEKDNRRWNSLQQSLKCKPRFSCLFSNNRKQEEAKKALESALGGKKSEFEKWDKEIKRREDAGGGGRNSGGGGWFGWFSGSNGDHFWQEAQQISLTILGIIIMYLIVAKGDVMFVTFLNPLLYVLRGTRNGFMYLTSQIQKMVYPARQTSFSVTPPEKVSPGISARENVVRKWRTD
ncbi:hypothetical protein M9H77_13275 [Catharanthus roseus]|uniref:Uncharacterized protein n=1 Tax=Catharanthus roseus TaxID=4058 RepID=A0ACC0BJY9_CATRO|nr:hypothetical protein M9H77_13275 [Catharanthus roseus]